MSVNGVTNVSDNYNKYSEIVSNADAAADAAKAPAKAEEQGVVYEKSAETEKPGTAKLYTQNTDMVAKMKADAEARTAQLRSLVEQLISKQGQAYGAATDMWQFLADGKFEVDAETKAQAQKDIAEDGYWGVEETSKRILDFAKALSGGDPDKADEMLEAFKKGYKEATKAWGKDLPEISSKTYDAVVEKFDKWKAEKTEKEATTITQ